MAPPTFSPLELESPKTRAQGVLEAAQAAPDAPAAAAEPAPTVEPPPLSRGWFGVARSALASPYTNAVALRDAPSELWVCFWCVASAQQRNAASTLSSPPRRLEAIIALNYFVLSLILTEYLTLEYGRDTRRRQQRAPC